MSMQTNQKMPNNPQTGLIYDVYTMRVRYTYKTHPVINTSVDNRRLTVKLYSPAAFGGPCFALNLQTGSNYVVSGKITHGNIFTDHCRHFQMKWPNLTWQQLRGMRGEYSKGCGCAIGFCIYCKNLLPGCRDFKFQAFDLCRDKYQHCEKRVGPRGETSCAWVNSRKCSAVPWLTMRARVCVCSSSITFTQRSCFDFFFFFYILLFIFLFDITKTLNKHSCVTDYMIYTKERIKTSVKQQSPSIVGQLGWWQIILIICHHSWTFYSCRSWVKVELKNSETSQRKGRVGVSVPGSVGFNMFYLIGFKLWSFI